ncbi:hypothetical protein D3C76_1266830 [compost metagenome]
MAVTGLAEMPLTKVQVRTAERVAAIQRLFGTADGIGADVHGVDAKAVASNAAVEQGHGDRVRLLAGGARQAEDAQWAQAAQFAQTLARQGHQGVEGLRVAEEPGFRDDHRFNQRLLFLVRLLQPQPVVIQVPGFQGRTAQAQGALDHWRADRSHVQADAILQKAKEPLFATHASPSPLAASSGGNNNWRTSALSKSCTPIRCSKPWASSRTGPR